MTQHHDFERAWRAKFSAALDTSVGEEIRRQVIGKERGQESPLEWSRRAMARLERLVDEGTCRAIMTACACRYPPSSLQEIRERYSTTGDIDQAHRMLQRQFESFLRETLQLDEELVEEVVGRGWGSAGVKQGQRIIATKIPKSGYLIPYLRETDPQRRRQLYCHCPRVREGIQAGETLSPTYCYCGAGFYREIWEEILQQPVEVEVLESVMAGDEVCKILIHLPEVPTFPL